MIFALLLALGSATAAAPPSTNLAFVTDARQAISAGRLTEARLLISRAVAGGASGPTVERLLAELAFKAGNFDEAITRYEHLSATGQRDSRLCEQAALAALRMGRWSRAKPFVDCAVSLPGASWRAWNARGVLADVEEDWTVADEAYERAHELAPGEAEILNNQGWSHMMRGDAAGAVPFLEQASKLDPSSARIGNNLELVEAAMATDLPPRRAGESDRDWAERLNDAGVAAELNGDRKKAIAAFTRALHASGVWYVRASNNLEAVSKN